MLKNIIFDFDGVIADTLDMNWALCQECIEPATLEDFIAHHDGNVFAEPRILFKEEKKPFYHAQYRDRLMPSHIERALGPLTRLAQNYCLFIISSNRESSISSLLEKSGTVELFTRVLGSETHRSKVEKFSILKNEYSITSDNAVFITDTLGDIKEANDAGIRTIAETFGYHDRERLAPGKPYKIVDSWEEIESEITRLSQ